MLNHWQNKLLHHSVPPTEGVWESIADDLDKNNFTTVQQYEVPAPENLWNSIELKLNEKANIDSSVSGFTTTKYKRIYFRIAVAASIVILFSAMAFWLFNSRIKNAPSLAQNTLTAPRNTTVQNNNQHTTVAVAPPIKQQSISINVTPNKNSAPSSNPHVNEFITEEAITSLTVDPSNRTPTLLIDPNTQQPADFGRTETPGTYLQITGPDGSIVRVSSKFSSIIGLLNNDPNNEEYLDIIIKESGAWKQKLKQWKHKMLNPEIMFSPQNFMNIVELSNLVQE